MSLMESVQSVSDPSWTSIYMNYALAGQGGEGDVQLNSFFLETTDVTLAKLVKEITVYSDGSTIEGVIVKTADGASSLAGLTSSDGNARTFRFQNNETIISATLWQTSDTWRAGAIDFTTNLGNSFSSVGSRSTPMQVDVGQGLLAGVFFKTDSGEPNGSRVATLALAMLKPLQAIALQIPVVPEPTSQPDVLDLDTIDVNNSSSLAVNWAMTGTRNVTVTNTFESSSSVTETNEISVSVEATFFGIVKAETGYSWEQSKTSETSSSTSTANSFQIAWNVAGSLAGESAISARAQVGTGLAQHVGVKATILYTFVDGGTFPSSGTPLDTMINLSYVSFSHTYIDVPIPPGPPTSGRRSMPRLSYARIE